MFWLQNLSVCCCLLPIITIHLNFTALVYVHGQTNKAELTEKLATGNLVGGKHIHWRNYLSLSCSLSVIHTYTIIFPWLRAMPIWWRVDAHCCCQFEAVWAMEFVLRPIKYCYHLLKQYNSDYIAGFDEMIVNCHNSNLGGVAQQRCCLFGKTMIQMARVYCAMLPELLSWWFSTISMNLISSSIVVSATIHLHHQPAINKG